MTPASESQKRLLVVEDSDDLRGALKLMLEDAGYAVSFAVDGNDALRQLREPSLPDAVLLDVLMPGMDGPEVLAHIKRDPRLAGLRIGVMTGIASGLVPRLVEADAYLFKPFGERELMLVIRELLGARAGEPRGARGPRHGA